MLPGMNIPMQILLSLIGRPKTVKPAKPTKVQKHQAKELAEAKMLLVQCESNEEYYRHMAEMYRSRIERIEGQPEAFRVGGSA